MRSFSQEESRMSQPNIFTHRGKIMMVMLIVLALACSGPVSNTAQAPTFDPTKVALEYQGTAMSQQLTLQAMQAQLTLQAANVQSTQPVPPTQTSEPPTQNIQPSPAPSETDVPPPAELVLDIQTSVATFYCYQSPYELTITVEVSDIDRGMAVYYHIQDKNTGVTSDGQSMDLRRRTSDTRDITIIGGGSSSQNLQFPPMMGESYFLYQIISDDGSYRSPVYSDVTFFPCGQ